MTHEFEVEEPRVGGMSGRQKLGVALALVVLGAGGVFIAQNTEPMQVDFLSAQGELPRWLMLAAAALSGAFVAKVVGTVRRRR